MCSRKQPLWRDLPGIIQRGPSLSCGPEQTFHPEKRAQKPSSLTGNESHTTNNKDRNQQIAQCALNYNEYHFLLYTNWEARGRTYYPTRTRTEGQKETPQPLSSSVDRRDEESPRIQNRNWYRFFYCLLLSLEGKPTWSNPGMEAQPLAYQIHKRKAKK